MLFLIKHKKIILICIAILVLLGLTYDYAATKGNLHVANLKITTLEDANKLQEKQLDDYFEKSTRLEMQLTRANYERLEVIKNLSADIKVIKNKRPPVICAEAITWAVENKGDLSWPK